MAQDRWLDALRPSYCETEHKEGQRQEIGDTIRDRRDSVLEDAQLDRHASPVLLVSTVVWTETEWETTSGGCSSSHADTAFELPLFHHMSHCLLDRLFLHDARLGQRGESNPVMRAKMKHEQKKVLLAHFSRTHSLLIDHGDPIVQIALETKRVAEARPAVVLQETPRESTDICVGDQGFAVSEKRRVSELVGVAKEEERRVIMLRSNCEGKRRRGRNHRGETVQLESILATGGEERGRGGKRSMHERHRVERVLTTGEERGRMLRVNA